MHSNITYLICNCVFQVGRRSNATFILGTRRTPFHILFVLFHFFLYYFCRFFFRLSITRDLLRMRTLGVCIFQIVGTLHLLLGSRVICPMRFFSPMIFSLNVFKLVLHCFIVCFSPTYGVLYKSVFTRGCTFSYIFFYLLLFKRNST